METIQGFIYAEHQHSQQPAQQQKQPKQRRQQPQLFWRIIALTTLLCTRVESIMAEDHSNNSTESGVHEVCQMETFIATCAADEVILIHRAQLGRLKIGRCVVTNAFGEHLGCSTDVRPELDAFCSGRHRCEVKVEDASFTRRDCHQDLKYHLWASYKCIKVILPLVPCKYSNHVIREPSSGYISSQVTEETGCGLTDQPWIIQFEPGQRINITVHDFAFDVASLPRSIGSPSSDGMWSSQKIPQDIPKTCRVYATIRDSFAPERKPTTICGAMGRVVNVFTSLGDKIELRILPASNMNKQTSGATTAFGGATKSDVQFLFHYSAIGCPEPRLMPGMWMKRLGDDLDIGCDPNDKPTWRMTCIGNKWSGTIENCTLVPSGVIFPPLPYALSSALICAIALIVGCIILVVGIVCIKWRVNRRRHSCHLPIEQRTGAEPYYDGGNYSLGSYGLTPDKLNLDGRSPHVGGHLHRPPSTQDPSFSYGNEYARTRLQRMAQYNGGMSTYNPHGGGGPTPSSQRRGYFIASPMEHIYESPDSLRREEENAGGHYTPRMCSGDQNWAGHSRQCGCSGVGMAGDPQRNGCGWTQPQYPGDAVGEGCSPENGKLKSKSAGNYSL